MSGVAFIGMANYIMNKKQRINVKEMEIDNKVLFSRNTGEVSLNGPVYCQRAVRFDRTIVIGDLCSEEEKRNIAKLLTKYGTISIYQDHEEIYYVFEKEVNTDAIIKDLPKLKLRHYC